MKSLLKIALFSAALLGCINTTNAQVNFGVKAGLNLANVFQDPKPDPKTKMLITYQVGGVVDIPVGEMFAVEPGIMLVGKGARVDDSGEELGITYTSKGKIAPFYLQVPVMFMYKGGMFYAGVGPYAGFGLFGKSETKVTVNGSVVTDDNNDIKFGNTADDDISPIDYGAQVEAGVSLPMGLRIGAGYSLGLADLVPSDVRDNSDTTVKNGVISVNVAYMFGGNGE